MTRKRKKGKVKCDCGVYVYKLNKHRFTQDHFIRLKRRELADKGYGPLCLKSFPGLFCKALKGMEWAIFGPDGFGIAVQVPCIGTHVRRKHKSRTELWVPTWILSRLSHLCRLRRFRSSTEVGWHSIVQAFHEHKLEWYIDHAAQKVCHDRTNEVPADGIS